MTATVARPHPENPHAGQGPVVLDIGGDVGALVVAMPETMAGVEIEIRSVDGQSVDSQAALTQVLDRFHPGDRLTVAWIDSAGQAHTATVVAAAGPVG